MGIKAHRPIRVSRGEVVDIGGATRVAIGGRGRALMRQLRVAERAQVTQRRAAARAENRYGAVEEHTEVTREIQAFGQILKDRPRESFDFYRFCDTLGPYTPVPFQSTEYMEKPALLLERSVRAYPLDGWGLFGGIGALAAVMVLQDAWRLLGAVAVLGLAGPMAVLQVRERPGYGQRLDAKLRVEFAAEQERLRLAHVAAEERTRRNRLRDEDLRVRLRESFGTRNPAPLGEHLEIQLLGSTFPLPVVLDVDFDGFEAVTIDLLLPEFDDLPDESTSITHSGRLAGKKIERAQKAALHEDACCGLALRVVAEVYRALPMVPRVVLRGLHPMQEGAKEVDRALLTVEGTREEFAKLNLTIGAPPDLVRQLGKWGGNRRGDLATV